LDSTGAAVTSAVLADFRIVKNGTAATLTGATVTHDANGYYTIALTTTNTDTTGRLTLAVGNTAQSMATHRYSVLLASVYDALITNATNATGGLATATAAIAGFSGTIATATNITAATGITVSTNNDKTGYSLTATTGLGNQTANITGNLSGSVGSVTSGVTVTTNNDKTGYTASTVSDKTGYALTATTGLGNQTADITGTVSTVTTLTNLPSIPANWLTAAGIASGAFTSAKFAAGAFDAVWSVAARTLTAISDSSGITTLLTRIVGTLASGTHQAQSGDSFDRLGAPAGASVSADILATKFAAEDARDSANDAASFANDALLKIPVLRYGTAQAGAASTITLDVGASSITDYYVGLAVAITLGTGAGQIRTISAYNGTSKVATVSASWTTNPASGSGFALVQAAGSGSGGSGDASQATLLLVKAKTDLITTETVFITSDSSNGSSITAYKNEVRFISVPLDEDITSKTVRFIVEDDNGADVFVVENASISRTSSTFSFTTSTTLTDALGDYKWALRDITSGNRLISGGVLSVRNAADVDA
jgi:hypothetical protein